MPSYRWTGIVSGVFTNKANWIDEATGVASIVDPANNDTFRVVSGNRDIDAEATGLTGCTLIVGEKYTGSIAPDGTLNIGLARLSHYGYAGNYGGSITAAEVECRGVSKVNFNPGSAKTIASLVAIDSNIDVATNAAVTTLRQDGGEINAAAGTAFTDAFVESGILRTQRDGRFRVGNGATVSTEGTVAKVLTGSVVEPGGELHHKTAVDFASSCEIEVRRRGRFHATESRQSFNARTVNRWRGSIVNYQTQDGKATFTEGNYGRETNIGSPTPA